MSSLSVSSASSVSLETLKAIAAFIPLNVARRLAQGDTFAPGQEISTVGVAMFVDIAGFTMMAEKLVNLMKTHQGAGHRSAETLNHIITQAFAAIITPIHQHGGVVTRFGGDALSAYFPNETPANPNPTIEHALQCATEIQAAIKPLAKIAVEKAFFSISVKVGLSYGPALMIFLGDNTFKDVVFAGPAIDEATEAEHYAERGDNILSPSLLSRYANLDCVPLADGFARLRTAPPLSDPQSPPNDLFEMLPATDYDSVLQILSPYLPEMVFKQVLMTQGEVPGDYRRVTNVFLLFDGLNYRQTGVGEKLQRYIAWANQTVNRFQGTLLRVLTGDKGSMLHITFGAPDQHTNDIEHALRCALALRDDGKRPPFITSQRIGLTSGLVFTAPIGSPSRREYTVIGDEINLSARLMVAAEPDMILVDAYSQERTSHFFDFSVLPPLRLKGKAAPITAYALLTARLMETGLESRFLTSRWPLVGRQQALAQMLPLTDLAVGGSGQVIAVSGALGIGKTRLIEEVVRYWIKQHGNGFLGQCNQHLQYDPYHAWIDFWFDFFRLAANMPPAERRMKVTNLITYIAPEMMQWIDVLAEILGFPVAEDAAILSLEPETQRRKLRDLTLALLKGRAKQKPLLMLFEDFHWADEASADLIDYVATRIEDSPILLCLLFRSSHPVLVEAVNSPHTLWLVLDNLPFETIEPLSQAILGEAIITPEVVQEMYDRTQGIPLHIEEIIENLMATNALPQQDKTYLFTDTRKLTRIPDTLQDLIRARLDRLETQTRDLAQVAAVINRNFSGELLHKIYPYPLTKEALQSHLDKLNGDDITTVIQPEPDLTYLFKNALTYEVAYNSLPFTRRQTLHQSIAQTIEHDYHQNLEEYYSLLAYHYQQANLPPKALHYLVEAGERAQHLYANKTAMDYYQRAASILETLPLADYWAEAIKLSFNRAQLHRLNADMAAAEADLNRALEMAERYEDTCRQAAIYNSKAKFAFYQEQVQRIEAEAQQAYQLATTHEHLEEKATALYHLGVSKMMMGDFEAAMASLQQAYIMAIDNHYRGLENEVLNRIAAIHLFEGHLERALEANERVYAARHELGLKDKAAETLSNIATLQFRLNQPHAALETIEQSLKLAHEVGWQLLIPYGNLLKVELLAYLGDYKAAQEVMTQIYNQFGPNDAVGNAYAQLTHGREILLDLAQFDEALTLLEASLATMKQYHIYEEVARTLVSLGTLYTKQKRWPAAQDYLHQAEAICLERRKEWYLSEVYSRLTEVYLTLNDLKQATSTVEKGIVAIQNRSNPDWLGTLLTQQADIAYTQQQPKDVVVDCYQQALAQIKKRCRVIERETLIKHINLRLLIINNY